MWYRMQKSLVSSKYQLYHMIVIYLGLYYRLLHNDKIRRRPYSPTAVMHLMMHVRYT